jgi:20S proteasome alpha/beta subunit
MTDEGPHYKKQFGEFASHETVRHFEGGAVIAADRQATHGNFAIQTVGVPVTKIEVIGDNVLFASSGPVGLGQQFQSAIEDIHKQWPGQKCSQMVSLLQKKFREVIDPAFQTAGLAARVLGSAAQNDIMCTSLLAAKFKDGIHIGDISPQGGVELLTPDIPFVCQGSGKQNADPIIRYLWSIFFAGSELTESDAVLAAYWTVQIAIDLKSFGVGFDTDVFVINGSGCKKLSTDQLDGHKEFIRATEEQLRTLKATIQGKTTTEIPPPPEMHGRA